MNMNFFTTRLTVDVHDVDYNGAARTSALMRYIQTAAQNQLTEIGMSYDNLKERNKAFLLSRMKMEFTRAVRAYEPLTAQTFPCESRGYQFLRCYQLMCGEECIGRAISVWALIDTETRSLVRVNDFELGLETYSPLELPLDRMILPKNLAEVGKYHVSYTDTDQNRHMNNTRYPDMYASFLPMDGKRIASISISYLKEAPYGEDLTVMRCNVGDEYYFRTIRSDGQTNSEAKIIIANI